MTEEMVTYDEVYESMIGLEYYYQHLAPSYDTLPKHLSEKIVKHLQEAKRLIEQADPFGEFGGDA